jgi:1,4-alpha-glucan branching enzyme
MVMPRVRFEAEFAGAGRVCLAGTFNDWDPEARRLKRVRKGEPLFLAVLDLEPGVYEYKYVVDGEWVCAPSAPQVENEHGTRNSVVTVQAPAG